VSGMCCEIGDWKEKTGLEILEEETAGQRPGHGHALIAAEFRDFLKEDSGDFTPRRRARTLLHDRGAKDCVEDKEAVIEHTLRGFWCSIHRLIPLREARKLSSRQGASLRIGKDQLHRLS
jgi:hypothetical protein